MLPEHDSKTHHYSLLYLDVSKTPSHGTDSAPVQQGVKAF